MKIEKKRGGPWRSICRKKARSLQRKGICLDRRGREEKEPRRNGGREYRASFKKEREGFRKIGKKRERGRAPPPTWGGVFLSAQSSKKGGGRGIRLPYRGEKRKRRRKEDILQPKHDPEGGTIVSHSPRGEKEG